jgi:hypothetical protein
LGHDAEKAFSYLRVIEHETILPEATAYPGLLTGSARDSLQKKTPASIEQAEVIIPRKGSYGELHHRDWIIYMSFLPVNPYCGGTRAVPGKQDRAGLHLLDLTPIGCYYAPDLR